MENQAIVLELLRRFLIRSGFQVYTARTGDEAMSVLDFHPVDLALIDFQLPDMHAVDLIRRIRESNWVFPVIVMSGQGSDSELSAAAVEAGAAAFLPKGIGLENIVCSVKSFLPPISSQAMR